MQTNQHNEYLQCNTTRGVSQERGKLAEMAIYMRGGWLLPWDTTTPETEEQH